MSLRRAGRIMAILFCTLLPACSTGQPPFDEAKWRNDVESRSVELLYAPHFKDGRFFNPWMPMEDKSFITFLKWKFSHGQEYTPQEREYLPKVETGLRERIETMPEGDFFAWIGHATFLFRISSEYWLTDPMFSNRALLPGRETPPALTAADIKGLRGRINIIISHNHYDHLDADSIRDLPEDARVFVPRGLKSYVESLNKKNVTEMDWWETIEAGEGQRLVCLPAQHWSRRITQDSNRTLWASFLLITPGVKIYYGADSGYFMGYREIGRRYPGIDYALLPITAYQPRWFMHYAHVDVKEALDAFHDLRAQYFVPTQWGAFALGDEPVGYAALELQRRIRESHLDPSRILLMDIGQIMLVRGRSRQ
jgi:N-acyl-phosphatidylethanolamine-hydrolysing phospholipase D